MVRHPLTILLAYVTVFFWSITLMPLLRQPRKHWDSAVTGDIGYHHVHHLNAAIPFYRLGAAMRAIPELQHPVVTSLRPRAIAACLRLKLWDESRREMVGYSAAREA